MINIRFSTSIIAKNYHLFNIRLFSTKINAELNGILSEQYQQELLYRIKTSINHNLKHPRLGNKEVLPATNASVRDPSEISRKSGDSSVLLPLVELEDRTPWVIMTHRSYNLRAHRGEICFPGGRIEENETIEQTAVRETHEEIGLKPASVKILSPMRHVLTRKLDNYVTPVIGIVNREYLPDLKPITEEVQCIYLIPFSEIYLTQQYTNFSYGKIRYRLPVFFTKKFRVISKTQDAYIDSENCLRIWGLSAVILNQFLTHLLPEELYKRDLKMPY